MWCSKRVDIFANSGVYVFFEADAANPPPAQPHFDAIQAYIRPDNLEPRRRVAGLVVAQASRFVVL